MKGHILWVYGIKDEEMSNGIRKHVALFDMLILWDGVQRRDRDVWETAYIAKVFNRVKGDRRMEDIFSEYDTRRE